MSDCNLLPTEYPAQDLETVAEAERLSHAIRQRFTEVLNAPAEKIPWSDASLEPLGRILRPLYAEHAPKAEAYMRQLGIKLVGGELIEGSCPPQIRLVLKHVPPVEPS